MESQSEGEILMRNMAAAASIIHLMQVKKKKGKKRFVFGNYYFKGFIWEY